MDVDLNNYLLLDTNIAELAPELLEVAKLFHEFVLQIDHKLMIEGNTLQSDILVQHIFPIDDDARSAGFAGMFVHKWEYETYEDMKDPTHQKARYRKEQQLDIEAIERAKIPFVDNIESMEKAASLERKRQIKRFAKLALYEALQKQTGKSLPWGALTGIRPTRLAYQFKEQGKDVQKEFEKLHVAKENIVLVEQILQVQTPYYQRQKQEQRADLYISIPFCPTRCNYCSFVTAPIAQTGQYLERYLKVLKHELADLQKNCRALSSIYVGGGTPLLLKEGQLKELLIMLQPFVQKGIEYTFEAGRPDVFTEEKLQLLKDFQVNRICVNPQTFSNATLQRIGRAHTVEDIFKAMDMAKKYQFDCNCDLIAGLTEERFAEFCNSVDTAIALDPENITVHTLSIKKGAYLHSQEDIFVHRNSKEVEDMLQYARKALLKAGYVPYYMYRQKYTMADGENIGWSKAGKECVYNIHMMEEIADTIACGANAISKVILNATDRIERYASPKNIPTYFEKIEKIIAEKAKLFALKQK